MENNTRWHRFRSRMLGVAVTLVVACGDSTKSYTRLHDAAVSEDGGSIVLLAETGKATLSGNAFSATWDYQPHELELWRLERSNGELRREESIKPPSDFRGFYGSPRLAEIFAQQSLATTSLPNCGAEFTRCAIKRAPEAFLIRDLTDDRDQGLMLIDPIAGKRVRGDHAQLIDEPWTVLDRAAFEATALEMMRTTTSRIFSAASERLRTSIAKSGALPTERSGAYGESAISAEHPGLMTEYEIFPGGEISAAIVYAEELPTRIRWMPSAEVGADGMPREFTCEVDRREATQWFAGCTFYARPQTLDPELVDLMSRIPELKASAATDTAYNSARKGLTFGVRYHNPVAKEVWVSCLGVPGTRRGQCDIDVGDTVCEDPLPILCVRPDSALEAPYDDSALRSHWFGADVATSQPVRGIELVSSADADARCAGEFGLEWRMARWSDHGEDFIARGNIDASSRFWVDATETYDADCWDEPR